jgi:NAD(P)-dependent dehydrogenase (short-subunit alcohol dehydrogenase family)
MPARANNPLAIITGAGRGIGRATAVELARAGYRVVLAGRDAAALGETLALAGGGGLAVATDVTRSAEVERLVAAALHAFGRIDALSITRGSPPCSRSAKRPTRSGAT